MNYIKLLAPAKVNLVLAIGNKLPDGYHEAHTIMHALALHDTIEIRLICENDAVSDPFAPDPFAPDLTDQSPSSLQASRAIAQATKSLSVRITCETSGGIADLDIPAEANIVFKAAKALANRLGRTEPEHLSIAIQKNIPHEAGLGGGSSNAAATLKGLAHLWGINPADPILAEVAASLGADVPFFLYGGCAFLDRKGDRFVHALTPRKGFLALVRPEGAGVSTKEAYKCFDENPELPSATYLEEIAQIQNAEDVLPWNNLTPAAIKVKPELAEVISALEAMPEAASVVLSGSGSAVAALCHTYEDAVTVSFAAQKQGWYGRVTSFASIGAEVIKSF